MSRQRQVCRNKMRNDALNRAHDRTFASGAKKRGAHYRRPASCHSTGRRKPNRVGIPPRKASNLRGARSGALGREVAAPVFSRHDRPQRLRLVASLRRGRVEAANAGVCCGSRLLRAVVEENAAGARSRVHWKSPHSKNLSSAVHRRISHDVCALIGITII